MAAKKVPSIKVHVFDQREGSNSRHPLVHASVSLYHTGGGPWIQDQVTRSDGTADFYNVKAKQPYLVVVNHLLLSAADRQEVTAEVGAKCYFNLGMDAEVKLTYETGKHGGRHGGAPRVGENVWAAVSFNGSADPNIGVRVDPPWSQDDSDRLSYVTTLHRPGPHVFRVTLLLPPPPNADGFVNPGTQPPAELTLSARFDAQEAVPTPISGEITVGKTRTSSFATLELALDAEIVRSTTAMSFCNYMEVINRLFCKDPDTRHLPCDPQRPIAPAAMGEFKKGYEAIEARRALPFIDADSYRVLKAATEAFVMVNCAVANSVLTREEDELLDTFRRRDISYRGGTIDYKTYLGAQGNNPGMLPYLAIIRRKLPDVPIGDIDSDEAELCFGILQRKLARPCMVELIWSYWHEEAMLVQAMNVITRRFQNVSSGAKLDPLSNLEIDPLRPLNNLIWGYVQDEQHRLTVVRRSYEYDHQYGLRLDGRAVQNFRPADSRSRFLEAFHQLLRRLNRFYRQDDDTNVKADAFPVLNAIKEVHMILSQGAHNQFGDLPSTARVEMLMQQWLLARPEFREFLPTRIMVAYPEPWMDRVDAMKKLQGWSDISVMHFNALANFGEQLLLSIRYGAWSTMFEPLQAFNWARLWRPQVQGYIHSYRAVTGVDLTTEQPDPAADGTLPSVLLRRRLEEQVRRERRL